MFTYFYHERIKTSVATFGSLFNNLYIIRKNASGQGISQIKVPIAFAPKRKYIERIVEDRENESNKNHFIALTLPRMSFEIIGFAYDSMRQLPKMNSKIIGSSTDGRANRFYTSTPYNIQFQLNIYGKTHDDALQVVEQIIPYFNPQYTLKIKPVEEYPDIVDNAILVLNSISFSDDYEGSVEQRRSIIYTLDFEMKINFYGPVIDAPVIRQADVSFFLPDDLDQSGWAKRSIVSVTIDPPNASQDSDYSLITNITLLPDN